MIIYTFLVNETAAVFQLLHISMCNLKYVTPLSGAALITRWLLRMTVVHVGLPQYNMDQTILTKNNFSCNRRQKT